MKILAAVDESADGIETVRLAAELALGPTDEVVAVCVIAPRVIAYGMGTGLGPAPSGMLFVAPATPSEDPDGGLQASVVSALAGSSCLRRVLVHEGTPERAMRQAMTEADTDLIIMPATQPRSRLEALVFGDPWGATIADARVPVLLARPRRSVPLNVLVVLDDPRLGADAVRTLTRFPVPADANVLLLGLVASGTHPGPVRQRQRMVRRTDVAMRVLRRSGLRTASLLRHGEGAADILSAAAAVAADMVVVGARRERGGKKLDKLARAVMGSADCSVLLIPALGERRRGRSRNDDDGRWAARMPGTSSPETLI